MLAHGTEPEQRVTNGDGRQDVGGVNVLVFVGFVGETEVVVAWWRVFAPWHLPTNSTIDGTVLGHPCGHVAVGNQQFCHEICSAVECSRRAHKVISRIGMRLKVIAHFQTVNHGLVTVQSNHLVPCGQFVVQFFVDIRIDCDASFLEQVENGRFVATLTNVACITAAAITTATTPDSSRNSNNASSFLRRPFRHRFDQIRGNSVVFVHLCHDVHYIHHAKYQSNNEHGPYDGTLA
mmetsp:Transcript_25333/g.70952  ORF Transcript_25333/g.70952 Transcript_25333/m.70952 type:complete len:235 (+) Transcript_25333:518-1222(+)